MTNRTEQTKNKAGEGNPMKDPHGDRLVQGLEKLVAAVGARAATKLIGKVDGLSGRLTDYTDNGGSGLLSAVTGGGGGGSGLKDKAKVNAVTAFAKTKLQEGLGKAFGGGGGGSGDGNGGGAGKGNKLKVTNIVEVVDVGVPLRLAYDQWTRFEDFPSFTKKVEKVEQESDEQLSWHAQVLWSHRTWESTIIEQIPDKRIVWRSKGAKGYVDGAVTFHELAPELTRITLILEYHPRGFFEYTGNLWRAQGRRARLEFKHFARHITTQAILHPDEIEGWRGEIRDEEVVKPHSEDEDEKENEDEGRPEEDYDEYEDEDYDDEDYEEEDDDAEKEEEEEQERDAEKEARQPRQRPRKRGVRAGRT
ncbi:MAG TPA: SRPBCC family protein [Streptosporangiaceae bacterium]|nr:SRPBCC family protein [Streptosporangiaceae bacterium]